MNSVGKNARILVVDDDGDSVEVLRELLEGVGYEVRTATDGTAALQFAASFEPDVVLLDIHLPGIDGFEITRRLASSGPRPPRVVAMTGYSRLDGKLWAFGFEALLHKPIQFGQALEVLADLGFGCSAVCRSS
ncbi:MAG TPA: response regulator [Polyangiaceae bacterium]|nr:response regulator [Polyangiaceae bacterium]